ncbi:MAG: helix-turn-helix domain-containing protein [Candidatus Competibacter sp.]|jgi:predicted DNA-binding transcriptional regulator AlpA|nr:helix-turn-helix domain-containing protein [Candidatus Competibacter sp.]
MEIQRAIKDALNGWQPKGRLLTDSEAAEYIGMSVSFLRQSRMEGRRDNRTAGPPFIRMGRSIRYDPQDLDAWLASNRCEVA